MNVQLKANCFSSLQRTELALDNVIVPVRVDPTYRQRNSHFKCAHGSAAARSRCVYSLTKATSLPVGSVSDRRQTVHTMCHFSNAHCALTSSWFLTIHDTRMFSCLVSCHWAVLVWLHTGGRFAAQQRLSGPVQACGAVASRGGSGGRSQLHQSQPWWVIV